MRKNWLHASEIENVTLEIFFGNGGWCADIQLRLQDSTAVPIVWIGGGIGFSRDRALEEGTDMVGELADLLKCPCYLTERPVGWHTESLGVAQLASLAKSVGLINDTLTLEDRDVNNTSRLTAALRSGNRRKQLWAATFGGGFGRQALPVLGEFSMAIDEVSQQRDGGPEDELFLGRAVISMAHIARKSGDDLDAADHQLILNTIEQLASDSRVQVLWHVLHAIEVFGMMSEPTVAKLQRHLSDDSTPPDVTSKIEDLLTKFSQHPGRDVASGQGGADAD